MLMHFSTYMYC